MPDDTIPGALPDSTATPVSGDGVTTIVLPGNGVLKMALDLPEGVGQLMMTESAAGIQSSNQALRGVMNTVAGALAGTIQTNFKDIGVLEGRTASGVMATPLASPTIKTS